MARTTQDSPRAPLTRERVLRAAVDLADEDGLTAVSMRRLAARLDVEAMSLYYHVADKGDLLDAALDLVVAEFEPPAAGRDWRVGIRRTAVSTHDSLLRHPWAASRMMVARPGPARIRHMDTLLRRLREAGFDAAMVHHAYHALDSHIIGSALWEASYASAVPDDADAALVGFLAGLPPDVPDLVRHVEEHRSESDLETVPEFEFGLDLLLDGLERIRVRGQAPSVGPVTTAGAPSRRRRPGP